MKGAATSYLGDAIGRRALVGAERHHTIFRVVGHGGAIVLPAGERNQIQISHLIVAEPCRRDLVCRCIERVGTVWRALGRFRPQSLAGKEGVAAPMVTNAAGEEICLNLQQKST